MKYYEWQSLTNKDDVEEPEKPKFDEEYYDEELEWNIEKKKRELKHLKDLAGANYRMVDVRIPIVARDSRAEIPININSLIGAYQDEIDKLILTKDKRTIRKRSRK